MITTRLSTLARAFLPDVRGHAWLIASAYGCRTLSVAAAVAAPWALKLIVDDALTGTRASFLAAAGLRYGREPLVLALTAAFLFLTLASAVTSAAEKNLSATLRERLTLQLRDRMLAHLLTLPPSLRTKHRSGELVLRVVDDTDLFVRVLTKTVPQLFQHALTVAGTLLMMIWVEPRLALAGLAWLAGVGAILRVDARKLWRASRDKRTKEGEVCGLAQEIIRGLAVVQASGHEALTRAAFRDLNQHRVVAGRLETRVAVGLERKLQITQGLALALVTAAGGVLVLRHQMTLGGLTLLTAYASQLLKPIEKLNDLAETTGRGIAGGERLLRLLDERPGVADAEGAITLGRAHGDIALRDVWFSYPDRSRHVLRGIDLRLRPGTLTVLVGPSGAGKSTLFSLLVRLADPERGTITLDGRDLREIGLRSLRGQVAVLSQDTHLFAGTIRAALDPGGDVRDESALWEALARVSLDAFVRQLPEQLGTALGEDGVNLSGGQRRRVALARAFLLDRPILLLDEPLANIDSESATVILDALDALRPGRTCFATTHDGALIDRADRVFRLDNGRLAPLSTATSRVAGARRLQAVR